MRDFLRLVSAGVVVSLIVRELTSASRTVRIQTTLPDGSAVTTVGVVNRS